MPPRYFLRPLHCLIPLALGALGCGGAPKSSDTPSPANAPGSNTAGAAPATGAEKPAAPEATPSALTHVAGSVGGQGFDLKEAVFLWREGADDLQIVLSDQTGVCDALSGGALPANATLLFMTLKHTSRSNRDAPFEAGEYPLRSRVPIEPRDTKRAQLLQLDPSCSPRFRARATHGEVRLSTPEAKPQSALQGELELSFDDTGSIRGGFEASYCTPYEEEPRGCR